MGPGDKVSIAWPAIPNTASGATLEPSSFSFDEDSSKNVIMEVLDSIVKYMEEVEVWEYSQSLATGNEIANQSEYEFQYEPHQNDETIITDIPEPEPEQVFLSSPQTFHKKEAVTVNRIIDVPNVSRKPRTLKHYSQAIVDSLVKEACRRMHNTDVAGIQISLSPENKSHTSSVPTQLSDIVNSYLVTTISKVASQQTRGAIKDAATDTTSLVEGWIHAGLQRLLGDKFQSIRHINSKILTATNGKELADAIIATAIKRVILPSSEKSTINSEDDSNVNDEKNDTTSNASDDEMFGEASVEDSSVLSLSQSGSLETFSDSDTESFTSSSSSDSDEGIELTEAEIRREQMKRAAIVKSGGSKVRERLNALKSREQLMKEHGSKRMKEGMTHLLMMHNPRELFHICQRMGFKSKTGRELESDHPGKHYIQLIVESTFTKGFIDEIKMSNVVSKIWNVSIHEYLRRIGHPSFSISEDPRTALMNLWLNGGLLPDEHPHRPQYVTQEFRKRYLGIPSEDITHFVEIMKKQERNAWLAEKATIEEHDFRNIQLFMKNTAALRDSETQFRDHLISELEASRKRLATSDQSISASMESLTATEDRYMIIAQKLTEDLSRAESMLEHLSHKSVSDEDTIQRMVDLVNSFIEFDRKRAECGGSDVEEVPSRLRRRVLSKVSSDSLREFYENIAQYRETRDGLDIVERVHVTKQLEEIEAKESNIKLLEENINKSINTGNSYSRRATIMQSKIKACVREIVRTQHFSTTTRGLAESFTPPMVTRSQEMKTKYDFIRPRLHFGWMGKDKALSKYCEVILRVTGMYSGDQMREIIEVLGMWAEDTLRNKPKKKKKVKGKAKAKGKGKGGTSTTKSKGSASTKKSNVTDNTSVVSDLTSASEATAKSKKSKGKKDGKGKKGGKDKDGDSKKSDKKSSKKGGDDKSKSSKKSSGKKKK